MRCDANRQRHGTKGRRHNHHHHDAEGNREILSDDILRAPAQPVRREEIFDPIVHQNDFRLLQRRIAPPRAHGHADVRGRETRRIVHAIAHHRDLAQGRPLPQRLDRCHFLFRREMSRRALNDVARNVLSVSSFGNLPYFLGRKVYDFVTGRRGMDLNQPTRLQSYSELKLLLSFNSRIDPKLRDEIERRIQNVSLNPLNNNDEAEVELARQQYESLIEYAQQPDGLAAMIERDRRAEMVPFEHGRSARIFLGIANVLTFGRYVHRETATPELEQRLEKSRRLAYHTQFLNQVAKSSTTTEVAWDMTKVTRSLQFLASEGAEAPANAARAAATIFTRTKDPEARRLCLEALSKINSKVARAELLKIYEREPQSDLRFEIAARLRNAVANDTRVKPAEAKTLLNQLNQQ